MKKIVVFIALIFSIFSFVACAEKNKKEETIVGDFILTINVSNTNMTVENTVTMTLKNMSGKDISIKTPNENINEPEQLLTLVVFPEMEDIGCDILINGNGSELIFEKNMVIERTIQLKDAVWPLSQKLGKHKLVVKTVFYMGNDYSENIQINTDGINIRVKG